MGDDPVQVKFECNCKEVNPWKKGGAVHISPCNSGTVTDSEESSIKTNTKSTMGFPTSHQSRSCVTPKFPKMGFKYPNLTLFAEISTINYLSNGINILAGDDRVRVKFGPKAATVYNRKDVHFTWPAACCTRIASRGLQWQYVVNNYCHIFSLCVSVSIRLIDSW